MTLIDDTYTVQWGKNKEDVLRFGFDANDKLSLKDLKSASVDSFLLPVVVNGKTRLYDIKKLDSKLQITESQEKEFQTIHELPELEDAPATLKAKNLYAYSDQARELEYFTADGKLVAGIPSSKTEATNEWKLETLTQDVDPYDLFKEYKTTLPSSLASLNILENDLYKIFADAFTKSFADKNDATKSLLT